MEVRKDGDRVVLHLVRFQESLLTLKTKSYCEQLESAEGVGLIGCEDVDARALSLTRESVLYDGIVESAKLV